MQHRPARSAIKRLLKQGAAGLALSLSLGLQPLPGGLAQAAGASVERDVKAAFLYKFLGYVEFPAADEGLPASAGAFEIGVVGDDALAAELTRLTAGRLVNNRPVLVRVLRPGAALPAIHLLFIGAGESDHAAGLLRAAQQAGVLSVTETENGLQAGSVINFRLIDQRIRFEVSLEAAEKSRLKLSSRLLSVAYAVLKGNS